MRFKSCAIAAAALGLMLPAAASANLLDDPGFEAATGSSTVSNSNWVLTTNNPDGGEPSVQFQFAPWASNPLGEDGTGVWFRSFRGTEATELANGEVAQTVNAGPGTYDLSFFVRHETNFTAEAAFVELSSDAGDVATFDLLATPNDGAYTQFSIEDFVASAGTTSLTVRAVMEGGVNPGVNPQSLFVDDFNLVPEPASALLVGAGLLAAARRRR